MAALRFSLKPNIFDAGKTVSSTTKKWAWGTHLPPFYGKFWKWDKMGDECRHGWWFFRPVFSAQMGPLCDGVFGPGPKAGHLCGCVLSWHFSGKSTRRGSPNRGRVFYTSFKREVTRKNPCKSQVEILSNDQELPSVLLHPAPPNQACSLVHLRPADLWLGSPRMSGHVLPILPWHFRLLKPSTLRRRYPSMLMDDGLAKLIIHQGLIEKVENH